MAAPQLPPGVPGAGRRGAPDEDTLTADTLPGGHRPAQGPPAPGAAPQGPPAQPPPLTGPGGLDDAEVAARVRRGDVNVTTEGRNRSAKEIMRANVVTPFNAILGTLLLVILVVGPLQDALFGLILVANTGIGVLQELRAKWTLDRLAVVTAPKARLLRRGAIVSRPAREVVVDDLVLVDTGDQMVVDGFVVEADGLEVDESLLTGESDPVSKARGDQLLSGSFVVAGSGRYQATRVGAAAYAARLAQSARHFTMARSELREGTDRMLRWIAWVMAPTAILLLWSQLSKHTSWGDALRGSVAGIVTMVPEGLVLLTSIAFAVGVRPVASRRVLAQELTALEGLARVDVVCLDKTGTLTSGRLTFAGVQPLAERDPDAALAALVAADPQPNASLAAIAAHYPTPPGWRVLRRAAFSSARKWSGTEFAGQGSWLLGAPEMLAAGSDPAAVEARRQAGLAAEEGRRVLLLAHSDDPLDGERLPDRVRPVALVHLADEIREDAADTLAYLRREGVAVKVISGDHPTTVGAIAARLGVPGAERPVDARTLPDDPTALADAVDRGAVFGRVTPQQKRAMVRGLQSRGHTVAMTGDGVNDVLALKDADVGIAMGAGSAATRAVAQLVLLDNSFAAVPLVLTEGRRAIANVERVANLFLTKTVYATLLCLAVGVARLPFPFLPRHLTLVSGLTIGIPAFFLALAPNARRARAGFVGRVLRFAGPTGVVAAAGTFGAYYLAHDEPGTTLTGARTTATLVLFLVALWVLSILARPATRARTWLIIAMLVLFVLAFLLPGARAFFALSGPRAIVWLAAVGVAALCGVALELGWRAVEWLRQHVRVELRRP